jgi:hypothetical protein
VPSEVIERQCQLRKAISLKIRVSLVRIRLGPPLSSLQMRISEMKGKVWWRPVAFQNAARAHW